MKLLFLLLLCVLILSQLARSPSFDIRFHGSLSIAIASVVNVSLKKHFIYLFIYLFIYSKFVSNLDGGIVYRVCARDVIKFSNAKLKSH